ncbi:MAG: Rrf2 family transcriptional regulator [bacterium]
MLLSQKCQYGLRAVFELAKRFDQGLVKIADLAKAQAIPPRFLEAILNQLKQGGFIESQRGKHGGYYLARSPHTLTVGMIIRFIQGPIGPVECMADEPRFQCSLRGSCVFRPVWEKVRDAMSAIYDSVTFQSLVDQERRAEEKYVPCYSI